MRELFKLVGEVSIAGVELVKRHLDSVDKAALKTAKELDKMGKTASAAGMALTKNITAPLLAVGAGLLYTAKKTADYAESILNMEQVTALSSATLQGFKHVADISGVSFEGLTGSIQQFSRQLPNIIKAGGPAYDAIKKLDVSIFDASGHVRDMNELFPEFINKLQDIKNVTERNSIAQQIFGRSINNLAPILGMTSEEFNKLLETGKKFAMNDDQLNAADKFGDAVDTLKLEFMALSREMISYIIPIFQNQILPLFKKHIVPLIYQLADAVKNTIDWFMGLSSETKKFYGILLLVAIGIGPVIKGFSELLFAAKAILPIISLLNAALLSMPFLLIVAGPLALTGIIKGLTKAYKDNIEAHKEWKVETLEQTAVNAFIARYRILVDLINNYSSAIKKDGSNASRLFGKELNAVLEIARSLGYVIEGDLNEQLTQLGNLASKLGGQLNLSTGAIAQFEKGVKATTDAIDDNANSTKKLSDFQEEWAQKVLEQQLAMTKNSEEQYRLRLQINEAEKQEAIKNALEKGENTAKITELYALKKKQIESDYTRALMEEYDKQNQAGTDWTRKLKEQAIEQSNDAIRKLELQKKLNEDDRINAVENARKKREDISQVNQYYDNIDAQFNAQINREKEAQNRKAMEGIKLSFFEKMDMLIKERDAAIEAAEAAHRETTNIRKSYFQQQMSLISEFANNEVSQVASVVSQIISLYNQQTQNKITLIDQQMEKEIAALDKSKMSNEEYQAAVSKIQKEADRKTRELKRDQAKREKALAIFNAIINTAAGIAASLAQGGIFGIVMAAIVAALGIAQIAIIAAQPLPLQKGAMVKGNRGGVQAEVGEGEEDELVLPMRTGVGILADMIIEKLSNLSLPWKEMSRFAMAPGGYQGGGVGMGGGEINLNIGVLIADDGGLKKLEKALLPFRVAEEQRRGSV